MPPMNSINEALSLLQTSFAFVWSWTIELLIFVSPDINGNFDLVYFDGIGQFLEEFESL